MVYRRRLACEEPERGQEKKGEEGGVVQRPVKRAGFGAGGGGVVGVQAGYEVGVGARGEVGGQGPVGPEQLDRVEGCEDGGEEAREDGLPG